MVSGPEILLPKNSWVWLNCTSQGTLLAYDTSAAHAKHSHNQKLPVPLFGKPYPWLMLSNPESSYHSILLALKKLWEVMKGSNSIDRFQPWFVVVGNVAMSEYTVLEQSVTSGLSSASILTNASRIDEFLAIYNFPELYMRVAKKHISAICLLYTSPSPRDS